MNIFKGFSKMWFLALLLVAFVAGCAGNGAEVVSTTITPGASCSVASGSTIPTVTSSNPTSGNQFVATSTAGVANSGKLITATFSLAMDPATVVALNTFTLKESVSGANVPGTVAMDTTNKVATFTASAALTVDMDYTASITTAAMSSGATPTAIACPYEWDFKTTVPAQIEPAPINLGKAALFGTFGGSAGMTNQGISSIVNGDIGTIATATDSVTGFHDKEGDVFTETGSNIGDVKGTIYTCTTSTTGPTSAVVNAAYCTLATQARLDAETAYNALAGMPSDGVLAGNLAGTTINPGVYTNASEVLIQGGDLTLDALGDADAIFVFQIGSSLAVGGPGADFPQSIILAGGAQTKNVFWQIGTFATINAGGGGTMVGTIIAQSGVSFSTAGNVAVVTLNGRALSLVSSVTIVNTVINVPAP